VAFVYWPITIQKTIQIVLTQHKAMLADATKNMENTTNNNDNGSAVTFNTHLSTKENGRENQNDTPIPRRKCYAIKCQLLYA
jgi:hypothetical protein